MGFATLPNQVHRKSVKKGFDFTLMVAGQFKAGKVLKQNHLNLDTAAIKLVNKMD